VVRSESGAAWLSLARVAKRAVKSYKRAQLSSLYVYFYFKNGKNGKGYMCVKAMEGEQRQV